MAFQAQRSLLWAVPFLAALALLPWWVRLVWAGGSIAVGPPGAHTGILCEATLSDEPSICSFSMSSPMLGAMLLVLGASLLGILAARRGSRRWTVVAALTLAFAWLVMVVDKATAWGRPTLIIHARGFGPTLTDASVLLQGVALATSAVVIILVERNAARAQPRHPPS